MTTFSILFSQFSDNPINWGLAAIFFYMLKYFIVSTKPIPIKAEHPKVIVFRNYTPIDLLPFTGENNTTILMGVNGSVYDVSAGRSFYGPGSGYANFAGRDASRGLAKHSFDKEMMVDPYGPIDKLEDLEADDWESLRDWEKLFARKYILVGRLVENDSVRSKTK